MGFAEAELWWEAWQLRLLVLGSLLLQLFLMVAAALRRHRILPWFRFLTWAAYQGSDALAIYALATLFNRGDKQQLPLEALWAPVLLLHLGGQDGITVYSIQDSELWQRHFLTAASQIVVAIYAFCKSRPRGDKSLLQAAILLFVPGTLKCLEKPFALRRASISTMAATLGSRACKIDDNDDDDDDMTTKLEQDISLEEFMEQAASAYENGSDPANKELRVPAGDHRVKDNPYRLFIDIPYPLRVRLANLRYMSKKRDKAHCRVRSGLSKAFNRLYTNYKGYPRAALRAVLVLLTLVAIRLFHKRRGGGAYEAADLKVTYVLLSGTAALECISVIAMARCRMMSEPPWPDHVAQCNLLRYVAHGTKHRRLRMLASWLRCDWLLWYCCTAARDCRSTPPSSPEGITELVHNHISTQWREHIKNDISEYHKFSDSRGRWTLKNSLLENEKFVGTSKNSLLESSMMRPFDESVILWHLATDFCFFSHVDDGSKENRRCLEISNYMVYLLLGNPEMLMPGARSRIFGIAYDQVRETLGEEEEDDAQDVARKMIQKMKAGPAAVSGLVHEAWELAHELMGDKSDDKTKAKMWKVIQGVWVEMLCFSAGRCSGYLHAKSLGTGGEFLSYIWMLRGYMGMQTLADKMQRLGQEADAKASDSPAQATVPT